MRKKDDEIARLRREAETLGFKLTPDPRLYTTTGFEVRTDILARFRKHVENHALKTKDAINQALLEWLDRREGSAEVLSASEPHHDEK